MSVCLELGKTEEEVAHWSLETLYRWIGFFRLKAKLEKKQYQNASANHASPGYRGGVTTIIE